MKSGWLYWGCDLKNLTGSGPGHGTFELESFAGSGWGHCPSGLEKKLISMRFRKTGKTRFALLIDPDVHRFALLIKADVRKMKVYSVRID